MRPPILIEMTLSPDWVPVLLHQGWTATHWSTIGDPLAIDREIMDWVVHHGHIVFTHDLDFSAMLALTGAGAPSVLQVRGRDVLPQSKEGVVAAALAQFEAQLSAGALVVVDERRSRVRLLPL
jgi:predicted nuclease of predicted toxin-antitoxin system